MLSAGAAIGIVGGMGRRSRKSRNEEEVLDGGIVVWKPRGPSSRAVVNRVQRQVGSDERTPPLISSMISRERVTYDDHII